MTTDECLSVYGEAALLAELIRWTNDFDRRRIDWDLHADAESAAAVAAAAAAAAAELHHPRVFNHRIVDSHIFTRLHHVTTDGDGDALFIHFLYCI